MHLCLTCRPCCQVQVPGAQSGATLPVKAWQGYSTTTSASTSSFGSGSGSGVAGAVSSTIVLRFFSSLRFCSSRRWRRSAMSGWSAKKIVQPMFSSKPRGRSLRSWASITCSSIFMAARSPQISRDELAQLLGGRSLVNHHHQHLPVGLHSNLIPLGSITGSSFVSVGAPATEAPRHQELSQRSHQANTPPLVATVRGHRPRKSSVNSACCTFGLPSVTNIDATRNAIFWSVLQPMIQSTATSELAIARSGCVIDAKSTGFEQICDPFWRPWSAQL